MSRSHLGRFVALLLALMLIAASCSNRDETSTSTDSGDDSGSGVQTDIDTSNCTTDPNEEVSGDTIKLVSSYPQSGLTAAFAEIAAGWKSYFKYINEEKGGVEIGGKKYKIETVDKDDEYNAQKTSQNIEELVGTDGNKAFAVFEVVGTANNINIRDFLGENCVPNLFAATGSPAWGNPKYPWTIGATNPVYPLEGKVFAEYLKRTKPDATVAMLVQNDDFGAGLRGRFPAGDRGHGHQGRQGGEVRHRRQRGRCAAHEPCCDQGRRVLQRRHVAGLHRRPRRRRRPPAAGSPSSWSRVRASPRRFMGIAGDAADNAISATNLHGPGQPGVRQRARDEAVPREGQAVRPDAEDLENGIVAYGWTQAALLVKAMESREEGDSSRRHGGRAPSEGGDRWLAAEGCHDHH